LIHNFIYTGYAGYVPFGHNKVGQNHQKTMNLSLCDFTSNYQHQQSTEWAPVFVPRPQPPLLIQSIQIYHKHVGLIPNYQGHVPGIQFCSGKTYSTDTRDAKRWLRGDYTI